MTYVALRAKEYHDGLGAAEGDDDKSEIEQARVVCDEGVDDGLLLLLCLLVVVVDARLVDRLLRLSACSLLHQTELPSVGRGRGCVVLWKRERRRLLESRWGRKREVWVGSDLTSDGGVRGKQ